MILRWRQKNEPPTRREHILVLTQLFFEEKEKKIEESKQQRSVLAQNIILPKFLTWNNRFIFSWWLYDNFVSSREIGKNEILPV